MTSSDPQPGTDSDRYPQRTGATPRAAAPTPQAPREEAHEPGTKPQRRQGSTAVDRQRGLGGHLLAGLRELVIVGAIALALSFLVKTFLVQAFYIPSESMEATLVKDDRVIVNKLTPRLTDLDRGDVVVFADPGDWLSPEPPVDRGPVLNAVTSTLTFVGLLPDTAEGHLIKRVIGLPGDKVTCCDSSGRLQVNGRAISEPYVKDGQQPGDLTFEITVPAGRIWVMGDNRGHSSDSRLHDPDGTGAQGSVPIDLVVGRAVLLVWPFDRAGWLSNYGETFSPVPPPAP